jgi:hypothetical protein
MAVSNAAHRSRPARVKVGEQVGVSVGGRLVRARVIEDRGDLGARGQQVVRLSVEAQAPAAAAEPYEVELPVDWLEPAPPAPPLRRTPTPATLRQALGERGRPRGR